ncbi:hypothetical protein [Kibdelosporangium phytohabitans]|uniref:PE domain-containing protein n=1 Tax=Kibdelosporangium phytohabitans TaxID=860235 RepID=A0A0N9HXB7_9PSEU|nr:hypothetical protein [Kibdelosporangium phytohabitans]ALG06701.1 hypothetical protein AOZ06_06955 [Kibdelosporangium phytohabitans]MBE1467920.1 hypothetical protein [Kibdelosporangium phytohabitans]
MYEDSPVPAGDGWQITPHQLREFAAAVAQVKADLDAVRREVAEFRDPALTPKLGTSPPARELADKFTDRIAGDHGLVGQLETAVANLQEFVDGAERTASKYQQVDTAGKDRFHE